VKFSILLFMTADFTTLQGSMTQKTCNAAVRHNGHNIFHDQRAGTIVNPSWHDVGLKIYSDNECTALFTTILRLACWKTRIRPCIIWIPGIRYIECAAVGGAIIISCDVQIRTTSVIVERCLKIIGPATRLNKQLPPKAMVNAILAGRALQRTRLVGMTPRGGLIKRDSGITH